MFWLNALENTVHKTRTEKDKTMKTRLQFTRVESGCADLVLSNITEHSSKSEHL